MQFKWRALLKRKPVLKSTIEGGFFRIKCENLPYMLYLETPWEACVMLVLWLQ